MMKEMKNNQSSTLLLSIGTVCDELLLARTRSLIADGIRSAATGETLTTVEVKNKKKRTKQRKEHMIQVGPTTSLEQKENTKSY